jgi:hypothetical protein|tara:strand:+ start:669 stop:1124 length:456 start_codon:yes stop_codon:yes gene_type:complete
MLHLQSHVNRTVKVPRPYFWKRLKAFDKIQTLLPKTIKEVKIPENFSNSPGDVRYVYLEKVYHGEVIERLDGFIEEKFMTYSVIDKSCLPVENYVSTVNIKKTDQNFTEVDWYGHFKALEKNKEETVNMFKFNYNLICDNMEKQYSDLNSN